AVARACVRDGCRVDVDADDIGGHLREQRRAVAFAAGRIEHAPTGGEAAREGVAMPVFVPNLAHAFGREAFASERQRRIVTHRRSSDRSRCQRWGSRTSPNSREAPRIVNARSTVSNTRTPSGSSGCTRTL